MKPRAFSYGQPAGTVQEAAAFIRRAGFALLMPHRGLPLPTLWEAIRGRPGGHPWKDWGRAGDRMWAWKDELPAKRLAAYGAIWAGRPGFASSALLPCLMRLWGAPSSEDGFRMLYREGRLSFDANRAAEALLARGAMSTYRLRTLTGIKPNTFSRAIRELERGLIVTRCGSDDRDTTWAAAVVNLTTRVFPKSGAASTAVTYIEARAEALAVMAKAAPALSPAAAAKLLRTGTGPG